jgi:hypothetical protein
MTRRHAIRLAPLAVTAACALALPTAAPAVVPPKNCGIITVNAKRYQIKADQISCRTAKRYSRRYLSTRVRPRGYRCTRKPDRRNKLRFLCYSGRKQFFAIRR